MLRVGIVGSGFIANHKHLPAWQKMRQRARVVALCDINAALAKELASRFGVPNVYSNFGQMLNTEKLDVVDICSPPRTHSSLAVNALQAGTHILLEKPMAVSVEECDTIIRAAQQANRKVCLAHSDLFYRSFLRAREVVKRGEIGEFEGMSIFLSTPVDYITSRPEHWAHRLPGGVLGETGPHVVYMTLAFLDKIVDVRVSARKLLHQFSWSPFEDYRLELCGEKATSSVILTYATRCWAAHMRLWGTYGLLEVDLETQNVVLNGRSDLKPHTLGSSALKEAVQIVRGTLGTAASYMSGQLQNTHTHLVRSFVDSIENGTAVPVTAEEGREAVRVMDLIVQKLQQAD